MTKENQIINLLKIKDLYITEIAYLCDCSTTKVHEIDRRYKIRKKTPKYKKEYLVKKLLLETDLSLQQIASECKCSRYFVNRCNSNNGKKLRDEIGSYGKLTPEKENIIIELLHDKNNSMETIGRMIGLSTTTIVRVNKKYKIR